MQGLSAAVEVFEKNWYPCFRRGSHGVDGIDPKCLERLFQGVLHCFYQRKPAIPGFPLTFQYRLKVVKCVEGVGKLPGIDGKDMRVEFGNHTLDDHGEAGDLLSKGDLIICLQFKVFGERPCFLQYTAGSGVSVLDVGAALPFEVKGVLPVKDRALLRRDLYDIIADGGKPDRTGDGPPCLLVKVPASARSLHQRRVCGSR